MQEKTVSEAIHYRRSVRKYDPNIAIPTSEIKKCIELASLAPNSSNMQLWEFYHITSKQTLEKLLKPISDKMLLEQHNKWWYL